MYAIVRLDPQERQWKLFSLSCSLLYLVVDSEKLYLSPKGIEFKRAYLYDINPVGFGSMLLSTLLGYLAYFGIFGQFLLFPRYRRRR